MLNFPETLVHVITPEVGGGFGTKLNVYPEEALVAYLAIQLGKPVKWMRIAPREFSGHHSRPRSDRRHRSSHQARWHDPRACAAT